MKDRRSEIVLWVAAAILLIWGYVRAVGRGDPVAAASTTYIMAGLLLMAAVNIQIRSRMLAWVESLSAGALALIVVAAAVVSAVEGSSLALAPTLRALVFLGALIGLGYMQLRTNSPD